MKKEDKEILLKDLSARLSYGVKLKPIGLEDTIISYATLKGISKDDNGDYHFEINDRDIDGNRLSYGAFKLGCSAILYLPYLRPMSSMTEEELKTYHSYCECDDGDFTGEILYFDTIESFDYLTSIHIDYRGLIPMGLAIEVTEENNPYK